TDNIRREYEILLNEVAQFNEGLLNKHRILAVTKADLLDDELIEMLQDDLPDDLPVIFISAVTGKNIMQLKDILWEELNSESNKLQSVAEGGSIVHRDREVAILDRDFHDWIDDVVEVDDDDIEEIEDYEIEDVDDE
ncbi:MAG: GTPase Obg, partial [Bacteroidaceae bacterium]|nr:GTPase Obg [Bacteroidaceae bacterium]